MVFFLLWSKPPCPNTENYVNRSFPPFVFIIVAGRDGISSSLAEYTDTHKDVLERNRTGSMVIGAKKAKKFVLLPHFCLPREAVVGFLDLGR